MDPRLLDYYNRELLHLREMGAEFAAAFPKIAARLGLEGLEVADPYVERLLEGFAFLAGRVQLKIDAEFPRFTQHLLEIVFPHYLAPTPAFALVEMRPKLEDPALASGALLPRGAAIRSVVPKGEQTACEFRTAHDVRLWPLQVAAASAFSYAADLPLGALGLAARARGGLRIRLSSVGGLALGALPCDALDFFVNAPAEVASPLHELVCSQCIEALVVLPGSPARVVARLGPGAVSAQGFDESQALVPYDRRSFQGYRLLREYFAFPERFLFFRVEGLRRALASLDGFECELVLMFARHEPALDAVVDGSTIVLNATPIVNLFPRRADRVQLSEGQHEHLLQVDRARPLDFEVFGVQSVRGIGDDAFEEVQFAPFYGDVAHHDAVGPRAYYTIRRELRQLSERRRRVGSRTSYVGSEVFVSIVDEREAPYARTMRQLAVNVLATNRDLPLLLPVGVPGALTLQESAPVDRVVVLKGPTRPRGSPADGDYAWRLVSHLTLNHLSLFDGHVAGGAASALRELLRLYADLNDAGARAQAESVVDVAARPVVRRLPVRGPIVFGRGLEIDLKVNESAFGGAGGFLLGAVLERFLARHVTINAFTQTRLVSESRGEVARWPARAGTRTIG